MSGSAGPLRYKNQNRKLCDNHVKNSKAMLLSVN